jgi:uncharacterized membrane protein
MNPSIDTMNPSINTMNSRINTMDHQTRLSLKPLRDSRPLFLQSEMDRLLSLSMLFSVLLVGIRMIHTGRSTFVFLIWNLFLAYVPYVITEALHRRPQWAARRSLFAVLFLAWLVFIPNSFYIITDLFHLGDHYNDNRMPQWYDLAMILSFVWNGLLLGILSVRRMEKILQPKLPAHHELFFLYPIMWLNALGVYTGRYLRFNSWDLIADPFQLFRDIAFILIHPLRNYYAWDMIFCFSILMTLMYLMLKKVSKTLD